MTVRIPLGRVLAGANRHDSPLLAPTLDRLEGLGPLPDTITVRLDAGYDSDTTERRVTVLDAFFDLADTIITVRSLIRRSWTTHRRDERPNRRP